MITIVIIEDEKPASRRLERMLNRKGLTVQEKLTGVSESIKWLRQNQEPDLIFLDIQLADGLSFEIFNKVKLESAIIFTTAYDEYAIKAFKLNSIDYLLKPIDEDELSDAIRKYQKLQIKKQSQSLDFNSIKELFKEEASSYKTRFTVQIGQHLKLIRIKDIECFYSEDRATYAFLNSGKVYLLEGSLESVFMQLDPKVFFKVNRKFAINLSAITDIISYTTSRLQIKLANYNQEDIIVSREKVKEFKSWLA